MATTSMQTTRPIARIFFFTVFVPFLTNCRAVCGSSFLWERAKKEIRCDGRASHPKQVPVSPPGRRLRPGTCFVHSLASGLLLLLFFGSGLVRAFRLLFPLLVVLGEYFGQENKHDQDGAHADGNVCAGGILNVVGQIAQIGDGEHG